MVAAYRVAIATAWVVALSGCSTAPVKYFSDAEQAKAARTSLPAAVAYLEAARGQYQLAVETQMRDERYLANGLIGAGALALGLALGNVSTGAITGTALVAGSAYTWGNVNLSRQTVQAYLAGIDALNCAEKAVAPLVVDSAQLNRLAAALDTLALARADLAAALVQGRAMKARLLPKATEREALDAAVAVGEEVMQQSQTTLNAGRALVDLSPRGARDLVATVNGIDAAVVRSIVSATPDLSALPGLVAGLAGVAGSFAPGAGIDANLLNKLNQASNTVTSKSQVTGANEFMQAAERIVAAIGKTAASETTVRSLMPAGPVVWPEGTFKSCGVAQVVSALSASVATLRFTAGVDDRQQFEILGGVKPYFVRIDGPAVDGLTVRSPVRFDNLAEVVVAGAKLNQPLSTSLRVVDSSATPLGLNVALVVSAAAEKTATDEPPPKNTAPPAAVSPAAKPAAAPASAPAAAPPPAAPANAAAAELDKLKSISRFKFDDKNFLLTQIPVLDGDSVKITIQCPGATVHKRSELARTLKDQAGIKGPPKQHWRIVTVPDSCAKD